jgi:phosphonate transport system substrate-binding protein
MVWRKDLPQDAKEKILYFFIQYGRFGDMDKIKRERTTLAKVSDGWGPFLASSNAQLLDVRQIEAFKAKIKAQNKGDKDGVAKAEVDLAETAKVVGKGGY